jgi:myo-inositol-1(or 4)-monophosphatase
MHRLPVVQPIESKRMSITHPMLNTAVKAARRAGSIINRASLDLDLVKVSKKQHNDFVTEVDKAAEEAIIQILLTAYPDHSILAEESGQSWGKAGEENVEQSDYVWIIDPLDGTTNFIHGFPQYCVSIALSHKGQITQAVIYDPTRNDLFTATKGRGAYLNDKRMRVSKRTKMAESLLGTGFPFRDLTTLDRYLGMFRLMTEQSAGIRRPGAAALDLAYVAAGRLDGFFEIGLAPWDIAAGSLMVTEAGGLIGDFQGDPDFLYVGDVLAGNPKIFAQLVQTLGSHHPKAKARG